MHTSTVVYIIEKREMEKEKNVFDRPLTFLPSMLQVYDHVVVVLEFRPLSFNYLFDDEFVVIILDIMNVKFVYIF